MRIFPILFKDAPVITNSTLLQPSENFTATNTTIEWCIAEGFPQPVIQWRLNDIDISARHKVTLEVISVTTNLVTVKSMIEMSLDHNDNGVFTCHASNNIGIDVNSTNLEVLCMHDNFFYLLLISLCFSRICIKSL